MVFEKFDEILTHVVANWEILNKIDFVKQSVDQSNPLIRKFRVLYPNMMIQMIEAYVMSVMLFMMYCVVIPDMNNEMNKEMNDMMNEMMNETMNETMNDTMNDYMDVD